MLASRGTPFLFHTFHSDSPPTQGAIKPGGMSVMEMHDHDDDDLPDEVVCAALRAAEFGHSIEVGGIRGDTQQWDGANIYST
jgi:hypothetical protein